MVSSMVSMHAKLALRSGRPSSTVCLNGPRSTVRLSAVFTGIISKSSGITSERAASRIVSGRWCASELNVTTAARRTTKSSSLRSWTNAGSPFLRASVGRGLVLANLRLVTSVQRTRACSFFRLLVMYGTTFSGVRIASLPRHSATMLRTPSSSLLQCRSRTGKMLSTGRASCAPTRDELCRTMTSRNELSSKYCCACSVRSSSTDMSVGRYSAMLPRVMLPSAVAAPALRSSLHLGLSKHASTIECAFGTSSARFSSDPISPRLRSARCVAELPAAAPATPASTSLTMRAMVSLRLAGSGQDRQTVATQRARASTAALDNLAPWCC
mmetsp:Transcript_17915/g.51368  ORF Transcript_17915/g.51368 Transcript_17915/m.51368 type:complete len:327 (+) Transcript_17915:274-1254(+)